MIIATGHCQSTATPCFLIFVLVRTFLQPVKELNVNTLCSFVFLAVRGHHEFKEICLGFFVVRPNLTLTIINDSNLTRPRHCQFRCFQHSFCAELLYFSDKEVSNDNLISSQTSHNTYPASPRRYPVSSSPRHR